MRASHNLKSATLVPGRRWLSWMSLWLLVSVIWLLIDRYCDVRYDLDATPRAITPRGDLAGDEQTNVLEQGVHRSAPHDRFFADAFFIDPSAIDPFMSRIAITKWVLFGAKSSMAQSEMRLAALPISARQAWRELAITVAVTLAALYASEHLVLVGRQTGDAQNA